MIQLGALWLATTLTTPSWAAPKDAAEEVVVYGDDFARWNNTRWLIQNEQYVPLGIQFCADDNRCFNSHAFQIRAVISCNKDAKLSRTKWEVSCAIDDVGIDVTTDRWWKKDRDKALVQGVLDEIDAKLTGMKVQMQVDEAGGVVDFDLEGVEAQNSRERSIQETLRQVVSRTMSGFHLRIPEHAQVNQKWIEYNSKLMAMPSLTASHGSTTLVHQVSPYKDVQLVQTLGEGVVSVAVPYTVRDMFDKGALVDSGGNASSAGSAGGLGGGGGLGGAGGQSNGVDAPVTTDDAGGPEAGAGQASEQSVELTYKLTASGVAVFRKSDGIMSERVWLVQGLPTAGSAGGVTTAPYRNAGRIQILGPDDKPNVGTSKQVAWPGETMGDLEPWVSVETMPDKAGG